jgi:hypothetical protein
LIRACLPTLAIAALVTGCRHLSPSARNLNEAVSMANRVLVIDNNTRSARSLPAPAIHLRDAVLDVVTADLQQEEGFTCLCYADLVLVWLRDDQRLAAIGLQPENALTWPEGPVSGDLIIPEDNIAQLHALISAAFADGKPIPFVQVPSLE